MTREIRGDPNYRGLARVIRFLPAVTFPTINTVSVFDARQNLLLVNERLYERLDPHMQRRVLHTDDKFVEVATTDLMPA